MPRRMLGITCCCVLLPLLGCSGSSKAEVDKLKADLETAKAESVRMKEVIAALKTGGPTANGTGLVTGKVLFKGMPLPAGSVVFHADDKSIFGRIDAEGVYQVRNVPPGKVRITVETASAQLSSGPTGLPGLDGDKSAIKAPPIPKKYDSSESTPLTYVVQAGEQSHDLSLDE